MRILTGLLMIPVLFGLSLLSPRLHLLNRLLRLRCLRRSLRQCP